MEGTFWSNDQEFSSSYACWDNLDNGSYLGLERPRNINNFLLVAVRQGNLEEVRKIVTDVGDNYFKTFVDSYSLVLEAVKYRRVCMLKLLTALGAVVNKAVVSLSPLHLACKIGDPSLARYLIQSGADINKRDGTGSFPIHYAVQSNSIQSELTKYGRRHTTQYYRYISSHLTHLLIANGASFLNCLDNSKLSPLHHAVLSGNTSAVSILLENNADVNLKGSHGRTPLWCAVYSGNKELADLLLKAGACPDCTDKVGLTLLHVAVRKNNADMTWYLLNYFRQNLLLSFIINKPSSEGESCLHYAAASLNREIMGALINFGASVNQYNFEGSTPLMSACSGHNPEEYLPPIRFCSRPHWSLTPVPLCNYDNDPGALHSCDYCLTVSFLVKKGAKINCYNNRQEAPLHVAAKRNLLCAAKFLVESGANVGARDDDGLTPLHLSVELQSIEMMKFLLEHGADADAQGEEYLTPLHLASIRAEDSCEKTLELIALLLEFNADVNAKNIVNLTPLYLVLRNAIDGQYSPAITPKIVDIYLVNGADVFVVSSNSRTPFSVAAGRYLSGLESPCESLQLMLYNVCLHGIKMIAAFPHLLENVVGETTNYMIELIGRRKEHEFYLKCLEEVNELKKNCVYCDISFYDLLTFNTEQFSNRLRKVEFESVFCNSIYLEIFPLYSPLIEARFCKALKRKNNLLAGQHFFTCLADFLNYPRLPLICVDIILKCLCVGDFLTIKKVTGNFQ